MIFNLTFLLIIIQILTIVSLMSWPYQLPYIQNNQYFNTLNSFNCPLYFQSFNQNPLLKSLPLSFLNFPTESTLISNQFIQPQPYNYEVFQSISGIPFQNSKVLKKDSQMQSYEKQQNLSESINNDQNHQEKVEKSVFGIIHHEKLKKQKNMISHNSSLRNDTKNIPKNYGKAMLSYIQKNTRQVKQILTKFQVDYLQFMIVVKSYKSKINTIHDLRQMWGENEKENKIMKCLRILSYHFMRKKCLPYIFNSRVKNFHTHIKYRKKIMQGIQNPQNFTKIKEF